jgi:hypothetical protein
VDYIKLKKETKTQINVPCSGPVKCPAKMKPLTQQGDCDNELLGQGCRILCGAAVDEYGAVVDLFIYLFRVYLPTIS